MKRLMYIAIYAILFGLLTACSQSISATPSSSVTDSYTPQPLASSSAKTVSLLQGTASVGGTVYVFGVAWGEFIHNHIPEYDITTQATGGAISNHPLMEQDQMDIACGSFLTDYQAKNGLDWAKGQTFAKERTMFSVYTILQAGVLCFESSPINKVQDLEGKNISCGPAGSTTTTIGSYILDALRINAKVHDMSVADATRKLQDGSLDALMIAFGHPTSQYLEIASVKPIRVTGFSEEDAKTITTKYPMLGSFMLPKSTYNFLKEDVRCIGGGQTWLVHRDVPEDVVYRLVKTTFENSDELLKAVPAATALKDPQISIDSAVWPLHPGATKYYEEIGLKVGAK